MMKHLLGWQKLVNAGETRDDPRCHWSFAVNFEKDNMPIKSTICQSKVFFKIHLNHMWNSIDNIFRVGIMHNVC